MIKPVYTFLFASFFCIEMCAADVELRHISDSTVQEIVSKIEKRVQKNNTIRQYVLCVGALSCAAYATFLIYRRHNKASQAVIPKNKIANGVAKITDGAAQNIVRPLSGWLEWCKNGLQWIGYSTFGGAFMGVKFIATNMYAYEVSRVVESNVLYPNTIYWFLNTQTHLCVRKNDDLDNDLHYLATVRYHVIEYGKTREARVKEFLAREKNELVHLIELLLGYMQYARNTRYAIYEKYKKFSTTHHVELKLVLTEAEQLLKEMKQASEYITIYTNKTSDLLHASLKTTATLEDIMKCGEQLKCFKLILEHQIKCFRELEIKWNYKHYDLIEAKKSSGLLITSVDVTGGCIVEGCLL